MFKTLGNALREVTAERDALKSELELEASARQREKALFAEAARQAKEESDRLVREREDEIQRIAAEEARLAEEKIREEDLLIICADHGCDPGTVSTDHSREYVPLLVYQRKGEKKNLGTRQSFSDLAVSVAKYLELSHTFSGESFL